MATQQNEHSLKISSFNVAGFNQCDWNYVQYLVDTHDFVFLQELWLHSSEGHRITDSLNNVAMYFVSGMPDDSLQVGRKSGGCCILWKSRLHCRVSPVPSDNRRLCAVKTEVGGYPLLLANIYMPCDTDFDVENLNVFNEVLNDVTSIADTLNVDRIVIGGDFNTDISRQNSWHTAALLRFVLEENLSLLNNLPCYEIDYTYESAIHGTRSTLDHFVVSQQLVPNVRRVHVDHNALSFDHSPIELTVNLRVALLPEQSHERREPRPQWHKASEAQIEQYRSRLGTLVAAIIPPHDALLCREPRCNDHAQDLRAYYKSLIDACIVAGQECIPHSRHSSSKKQPIPLWTTVVKPLKDQALLWQSIWKSCGSPTTGHVASIRRSTRARYHRAIRHLKRNDQLARFSVMGENFMHGGHGDFWTEVKKMRGQETAASYTVDNECTDSGIAELFHDKYSSLYTSVGYNPQEMITLEDDVNQNAYAHLDCPSHLITFTELFQCMKEMKKGKHDGNLGQYSDHVRLAPQRFACCLLLVFNALLMHGVVPEEMCLSTVSPIPKNKRKCLSDSENYRAIALSSIMGKLLDKVFLLKCASLSNTSDMQFGFKKGHSTMQCSFVVREVIEYYNSRGSDVYIALLDASKAFDRVEFTSLFRLIISKGICPIVARFLLRMYTQQQIRVRWGTSVTEGFQATNGVKQGGVLSPSLFTLFVDPLLKRLSNLEAGCCIGEVCCASLGYADDIILLSPTRQSLRRQLQVCATYAAEFKLLFNSTKSKAILVPHNQNSHSPAPLPIPFMGGSIDFVPNDRHLGCLVGNVTADELIDRAIKDFNKRVAMLRCHFKWLLPRAKYFLFKSYCMPLYGCVLWDFSHSSFARFCVAWRKAIRSLLGLHPRTHSDLLPSICEDMDAKSQLLSRCVGFTRRLAESTNVIVKTCFSVAFEGSRSAFGRSLSVVCEHGRCDRDAILSSNPARLFPRITRMEVEGSLVRDLLGLRHEIVVERCNDFNLYDINFLIDFVCTN